MKTEKKIEKKICNFIKKNICHNRIFFQKEWLHSYYLSLKRHIMATMHCSMIYPSKSIAYNFYKNKHIVKKKFLYSKHQTLKNTYNGSKQTYIYIYICIYTSSSIKKVISNRKNIEKNIGKRKPLKRKPSFKS